MATRPHLDFELTFGECRPCVVEHRLSALQPLIALSGLYQQGTRSDQAEHIFQVSKREDAGHAEGHLRRRQSRSVGRSNS
jgi:hypothetical protein